ncbi:MAG: EpsG family protein [Clostridia bacterium]|nr:EpsG family protein [Clostridia bacterium]
MTTDLLTVFLFSYFTAALSQRVPSLGYNIWGKPKANLLVALIPTAIMLVFSALRNNIGDTYYYTYAYDLAVETGIAPPTFGSKAFLFYYMRYLLQKSGFESHSLVTVCAILIIIPLMFFLRDYAFSFDTAVFFCFATGYYGTTMNGIRQYVATGILLLGTRYLFSPKKSDFFKYLILILIAYLIHSSALILIPIYFVCRQRAWSLPTFAIVIGSMIALVFVSLFLPSFMDLLRGGDYEVYTQGWFTAGRETGTNIFRILFNCIPVGLAAYFSREIRPISPVTDILINLSVVHAGIYLLAGYNWIFARFAFYTMPYVILLLTLIFGVCLKQRQNRALYVVLLGVYLVFFIKESYANGFHFYSSDFFTPNRTHWFEFLA